MNDAVKEMVLGFNMPSTSRPTGENTSTENDPEREAVSEALNLPIRALLSKPEISRGRIRSTAAGARPDRPCNRDRTELITQSLMKMIGVDMLPLSFVTSNGFREFMNVVDPNFNIPCRQTIKNRLVYVYEQVSTKIAAELSEVSVVAWTSECWSSRSQDAYVTVTMNYLDSNWIPKTYTLATEELSEHHTAANLTAKMKNEMIKWNLVNKVSTVVTDNALNAKNSVRDLEGLFINEGVTCAAHSLQLCVTKAMALDDAAAVCDKASKVVTHFRHSNIAATALERKQEQLGVAKLKLIQNCSTRWDSTYEMIKRIVLSDRTLTTPATAVTLEISER